MRFILETKLGKLKIKNVSLQNQWEEWCLDNKEKCLEEICGRYFWTGKKTWKETDQGIVVGASVFLEDKKIKQIPFKFYKAGFGFYVSNNLLTSLINSPEYVEQDFIAHHNKLQNLIGGPRRVEENYNVNYNQIKSLEGAPEYVGESFWIQYQEPPGKQWAEKEIRKKTEVGAEVMV